MKLLFSSHKDTLKRTALLSLSLFLAAHAFCFFNLTYSGSSVMLDVSKIRGSLIETGRFLAPYYFRLRGTLSAPLWVGMLSALYMTLTSIISAWLLGLKKPWHLFILCGTLAANAALTSVFAASLHTADAVMLALLFCSAGAACCLRLRFGFVPGAALLAAAMALDPGSLAFFAAFTAIAWINDLLADDKASFAWSTLLSAAAGIALWFLGSLLMTRRNGYALSMPLHMPEAGILSAYPAVQLSVAAGVLNAAVLRAGLAAALAGGCGAGRCQSRRLLCALGGRRRLRRLLGGALRSPRSAAGAFRLRALLL